MSIIGIGFGAASVGCRRPGGDFAQAPQAGLQLHPDVGTTTGGARPTRPGPSDAVVDADYREAGKG